MGTQEPRLSKLLGWIQKGQAGWLANAAGLYLDTFASYLFPLITLPYLVRVLGPRGYGLLTFSQSLIGLLVMVAEFGFLLSGTRQVAALKTEQDALWRFVMAGTLGRLGVAACLGPLLGLASLLPPLQEARSLLLVLFGTVLAAAASPNWVFLGLEKMWWLSRLNLLINTAVVGAILLLVRSPDHLLGLAAILTSGPLLASAVAWLLAVRQLGAQFHRPSWDEILRALVSSSRLFASQLAMGFYTTANPFLLGLLASKEVVAYFAAAEKVVRALLRLLSPLGTALFPHMVHMASLPPSQFRQAVGRVLLAFAALGGSMSLALMAAAPPLVAWALGPAFAPAVSVLRTLGLLCALVAASNVFGLHVLLPLRRDTAFSAIVASAGLMNFALAAVLVPQLQAMGMAWAAVASEAWVTATMGLWAWRLLRSPRLA